MKLSQPQLQASQSSEMVQPHQKTVAENYHSASAPKKSSAAAHRSAQAHMVKSQQKSMKTAKYQDAIMEEQVEDSAQNTKRQSMENANSHRTKENISDFVSSTQHGNLDASQLQNVAPNKSHSQSTLSASN